MLITKKMNPGLGDLIPEKGASSVFDRFLGDEGIRYAEVIPVRSAPNEAKAHNTHSATHTPEGPT